MKSYRIYFILSLSLFLYLTLSLMYSTEFTAGKIRLESHASLFIFPIAILGLRKIVLKYYDLFLIVFVFANIFACICCWGNQFMDLLTKGTWEPYYVSLSRFLHPTHISNYLHPSYFAMFLAFAMLIVWDKIFKGKSFSSYSKNEFLYLLVQLLFGITILFLSSKAGIFAMLTLAVSIVFVRMIELRKLVKPLLIIGGIGLITLLIVLNNPRMKTMRASLDENKLCEMANHNSYSSTGARMILWKSAIRSMDDHWGLGHGIGDAKQKIREGIAKQGASFSRDFDAHNQFLEFLTIIGLFGLFIFLVSILYSIQSAFLCQNYLMLGFFVLTSTHFMAETMMTKEHGVMFYAFFAHLLWVKMDPNFRIDSGINFIRNIPIIKRTELLVFTKRSC